MTPERKAELKSAVEDLHEVLFIDLDPGRLSGEDKIVIGDVLRDLAADSTRQRIVSERIGEWLGVVVEVKP